MSWKEGIITSIREAIHTQNVFFTAEDKRYYVDAEGVRPEPGWFSTENVDSKESLCELVLRPAGWFPF